MDASRKAAKRIHEALKMTTCPGGKGHLGTGADGAAADFCDACIENALVAAYRTGQEDALSPGSRAA